MSSSTSVIDRFDNSGIGAVQDNLVDSTSDSVISEDEKRRRKGSKKTELVVCTDGRSDDCCSFLVLLEEHKKPDGVLTIRGITTTFGNTDLENVNSYIWKTLEVMSCTDVNIYAGASGAFGPTYTDNYFGTNMCGDNCSLSVPKIQDKSASDFIIQTVLDSPGEVVFLALGPLTNLATAIHKNNIVANGFREVVFLGGNIEGKGTATLCAEYNVGADATSASYVFNNIKSRFIMFPKEVRKKSGRTSYDFRRELSDKQTDKTQFLDLIERNIKDSQIRQNQWAPNDVIGAVYLLNENVVIKSNDYYCQVSLNCPLTFGMVVTDWNGRTGHTPNCTVVLELDIAVIETEIRNRLV